MNQHSFMFKTVESPNPGSPYLKVYQVVDSLSPTEKQCVARPVAPTQDSLISIYLLSGDVRALHVDLPRANAYLHSCLFDLNQILRPHDILVLTGELGAAHSNRAIERAIEGVVRQRRPLAVLSPLYKTSTEPPDAQMMLSCCTWPEYKPRWQACLEAKLLLPDLPKGLRERLDRELQRYLYEHSKPGRVALRPSASFRATVDGWRFTELPCPT